MMVYLSAKAKESLVCLIGGCAFGAILGYIIRSLE